MLVRKIAVALIVVGSLIVGYTGYAGSTARASHNCSTNSAFLAANPELSVACQSDVIAGNDSSAQRAFEADAARYTAMADYYLAQNGTNVQRANAANAARYTGLSAYLAASPDKLSWFR